MDDIFSGHGIPEINEGSPFDVQNLVKSLVKFARKHLITFLCLTLMGAACHFRFGAIWLHFLPF